MKRFSLLFVALMALCFSSAWADNVAKIGSTNYTSLADAIAAVSTDGTQTTITMLADEAVANGVNIAAGQNIVLELNGKTISGNTNSATTYALITNKGTLTIQDNTDTSKDGTGTGLITTYISNPDGGDVPGYASNTITNNGTLTVKSGKIVNNGSGYACYAIDNQTNGNLYSPVLNIEGGRMEQMNGYTYAVRMFCNSTTNTNSVNVSGGVITGGYGLWLQTPNDKANMATLSISGGTIEARDGAALYIGGTKAVNSEISIDVTGGEIGGTGMIVQGPLSGTYGHISVSGGEIENVQCGANVEDFISGGTFGTEPNAAYLADGATTTNNGDGSYVINAVAKIGSTYYCSLAEAVAAVPANGTQTTITMIANETMDGNGVTIATGKNIVLELNGKTITGNTDSETTYALITNKGTLTIQDNTDTSANGTGTGKLEANPTTPWVYSEANPGGYASNLIRNEGTLVVESGYLINNGLGSACYAIDNYSAGNVTINGGKVDAAKASAVRMFNNNGGSVAVNGGVIGHNNSDTDRSYMGIQIQDGSNATVSVTGGSISGQYAFYATNTGGDIDISGGTFDSYVMFGSGCNADISISGGTIWYVYAYGSQTNFVSGGTYDYPVSAKYCVEGYKPVDNGDNTYGVTTEGVEIYYSWTTASGTVGESCLFAEPFTNNYLCDGESIKLLKNVTLTSNIACQLTSGSFTLTQGEFAVTKGEYAVTLKAGVSVVTDKQTDIFATEDENSTIVETAVAGGYTYTAKLINYVINDGDAYTFTSDVTGVNATYKRSFGSDRVKKYQGWFVPFDYTITAADLQKFKFFQINMIAHSATEGSTETTDPNKLWIHLIPMAENGVLKANTPYIFTPQEEATDYEFTTTNATLKALTTGSVASCSTMTEEFNFYGVYSSVHPEDASDIFYYMAKSGQISRATKTSTTVGANRWIFRVTPKDGSQSSVSYSIGFVVNGVEDDDVTAVSSATDTTEAQGEVVGYYTLSGQQVSEPTKGVYVVKYANGTSKKVVF